MSDTTNTLSPNKYGRPVNVKRLRRKNSSDADPSRYQTIAPTLIFFILFLYLYGLTSSIVNLPDVEIDGLINNARKQINLSNDSSSEKDAAALIQSVNRDQKVDEGHISEMSSKFGIPIAIWPVPRTNRQKDQWITLSHPGDEAMTVTLPPFWSSPVHNNELMSREKAMMIGTCVEADSSGNYQRGDDCPLHQRTIFVAIASYRDWQCKHTVTSIFDRAKHPERIRVAVVDQIVDGDDICDEPIRETCEAVPEQAICKYADQIDVYQMDAPLAVGPVFARHIGHRQYRGEYYAMQSDAHVTFTQDWDDDIIEQLEATKDEMAVLTTYLTDVVGSIDEKTGKSLRSTRPIMCNTAYEGGVQGTHLRHLSQPEQLPPSDLTMPQLEPWWAAGFSFSRGHFVVNVPYDFYQPMIFQGEEMSIGIRGFTIGYDYFAPQRSVCFHHYASMNKDRVNVPHFWENTRKYAG
jgi:Glycosyltransferase (GlcNAc).